MVGPLASTTPLSCAAAVPPQRDEAQAQTDDAHEPLHNLTPRRDAG